MPASHWEQVAYLYNEAIELGVPVHAHVASGTDYTVSSAATAIMKARRRGLLPPTTQGKTSGEGRLERLAGALGVTPDDLRIALIETCDGKISVNAKPSVRRTEVTA